MQSSSLYYLCDNVNSEPKNATRHSTESISYKLRAIQHVNMLLITTLTMHLLNILTTMPGYCFRSNLKALHRMMTRGNITRCLPFSTLNLMLIPALPNPSGSSSSYGFLPGWWDTMTTLPVSMSNIRTSSLDLDGKKSYPAVCEFNQNQLHITQTYRCRRHKHQRLLLLHMTLLHNISLRLIKVNT